jgi:hypothetical protein
MSKMSGKNCRTYISTFYVLAKLFHKKPTLLVSCVKKKKIGAKNSSYWVISLSFLYMTKKWWVSKKKWHAHLKCRHVCTNFLFDLFFKYNGRSICTRDQECISILEHHFHVYVHDMHVGKCFFPFILTLGSYYTACQQGGQERQPSAESVNLK